MERFWVDLDGEGEPTIWTGDPERPTAILRRCEISGSDEVRDEVMRRIADPEPAPSTPPMGTWRCTANSCEGERHVYSGWEDRCAQVKRHAREVAHDARWPLTITLHDATGRQYAVDYEEAVLTKV